MDKIDMTFMEMVRFDAGDARRIQHFTKVHAYAHLIGAAEGLDEKTQQTLELAAVVHDIGIIPAEKKYGYQNGKIQEEMGPALAIELLERVGIEKDVIERVAFLVAHHHTWKGVDSVDWQILLEADFLVNSLEKGMAINTIENTMNKLFKTEAGIQLCKEMYGL
ncbi:MAG: HD domain-containing protein [Bacillota bacterium]|nr:HD domain-containing protein [Bacillota bacterium]